MSIKQPDRALWLPNPKVTPPMPAVKAPRRATQVDADEYAKLCADHLRARDKLLEIAKECASCGGTGCVTIKHLPPYPDTVEPCGDCLDIREVLE